MYAAQAVNGFSAPENRAALRSTWEQGVRRLIDEAEPGSDHQLTFVRSFAAAAHSDAALDDLEGLLDGTLVLEGLTVDTDLRWSILTGLARGGREVEQRIADELGAGQHHRRSGAGGGSPRVSPAR